MTKDEAGFKSRAWLCALTLAAGRPPGLVRTCSKEKLTQGDGGKGNWMSSGVAVALGISQGGPARRRA